MTFGLHAGATFRVFQDAARDPERLALVEVNPRMPRIEGLAELGGNRVHVSEVDGLIEHETELPASPAVEPAPEELAIARHVAGLVDDGAVLQFGIGGVPDEVARLLASGARGGFAIHTELIGDGVMHLHQAGKVANRKPLYDGVTVATFALGSAALYAWLDGNPAVRMLPVSATNEPALLQRLEGLVSVNGALAVDLAGQVVADHVGGRQYSGVGGHESFVTGASEAPGGRSFVCLESTATVGGARISRIVPGLPPGSTVTTPRHHVQYVVTEYGAVDLSMLGDRARARTLIELAHPDFRDGLREHLRAERQ
jgi:acyl-CoA hydrolase